MEDKLNPWIVLLIFLATVIIGSLIIIFLFPEDMIHSEKINSAKTKINNITKPGTASENKNNSDFRLRKL